jgi:uncharacterized protein with HEPN domain
VNRRCRERLDDLVDACRVIRAYVSDPSLPEGLVYDAIRMRLVEIGEAVRTLPSELIAREPDIPWARVSQLGERLTRRYFDTTPAIVLGTARWDVPGLLAAAERLRAGLGAEPGDG